VVVADPARSTRPGQALNVLGAELVANDTDVDGDALFVSNYQAVTGQGGTVQNNVFDTFVYTPAAGFVGIDTLTYTVSDGVGGFTNGSLTINVVNGTPVVVDDTFIIRPEQTLTLSGTADITADDSDPDGDVLLVTNYQSVSAAGGSIANPSFDTFLYTPLAGFVGTDTFQLTVGDGFGGLTTTTVTVNVVNVAPTVAADDARTTRPDVPLTIIGASLLANDTDGDGDALIVSNYQAVTAQGGTVTNPAFDTFVYTPAAGFVGTDTFAYVVSDGFGGFTPGSLTINVVNAPPSAGNDSYSVVGGQTLNVSAPGLLANDTDLDGDTLEATNYLYTGPGTLSVVSDGSFSYTPAAGFSGTDSFTYQISDGFGGNDTAVVTLNVLSDAFQVVDFAPTATGFTVRFNRAFDLTTLNLYDGQGPTGPAGLGAADVTLTSSIGGLVRGSIVPAADQQGFTFIKTGDPLVGGTHQVRLVSGATALRDLSGQVLDGDGDGVAGGDYVTSFQGSVVAGTLRVPDFMRGPGQPANVPATSVGIPIALQWSGGVAVNTVSFELRFDPALLDVTSVVASPSLPPGASVTVTTEALARGRIKVSLDTTIPASGAELVRIIASVPATASYGAKHVLDLANVVINDGSLSVADNDGVHLVGYFGDTSGDATYTTLDPLRVQRVIVGLDSGFAAYPLVDPVIVADISGNGVLSSLDASRLAQEIAGLDRPEIPPLPATTPTIVFVGPDPALSLGKVEARAGTTVVVPLSIDVAQGLESLQARIAYDADALDLVTVNTTSLTSGFVTIFDTTEPGMLRVDMSTIRPLEGGGGALIKLTFRVGRGAAGTAAIDLQSARLNDGALVLTPLPVAGADATDGAVNVTPAKRAVQSEAAQSARIDWLRRGAAALSLPSLPQRGDWIEDFVSNLGKREREPNQRLRVRLP